MNKYEEGEGRERSGRGGGAWRVKEAGEVRKGATEQERHMQWQ